MASDAARNKAIYFARLAEQAERYDEMIEHLKEVRLLSPDEITEEEQQLLSVAYSHTVSTRKAAWRRISDAAREATKNGNEQLAQLAFNYRSQVEDELNSICARTRDDLIPKQEMTDEATVFYQKMKADTYRHAAELGGQSPHVKAAETAAQEAFADASALAQSALPPTHPLQFGLALSRSIFESGVLGKPREACHLPSCESVSPHEQAPAGFVAQRLCDLLLEFPEAAIGGVRWSTLLRTYADVFNEELDISRLGHETPSAAARALLTDILRHQRTGQALGQVPDFQQDPAVAVDDNVVLTPLPGFAGSWPSLYKSLCALVLSCGAQETVDSADGAPPKRILLMSQLRPLLDSAKEEGKEQNASVAGALHARSLLLSQLQPVSKLCKECSAESGLSFRGEDGGLKKLHKLGHVVKAVLQWREQRLLWRHSTGETPTAVDEALMPKLELVFSKRRNNLVLCLYDAVDSPDDYLGNDPPASPETVEPISHENQPPSVPPIYENPFKWRPLSQFVDPRIGTAARPFGCLSRCISSPPMCASIDGAASPSEEATTHDGSLFFSDGSATASPEGLVTPDEQAGKRWASPIRCASYQIFCRRSPSRGRGARSPSCPVRTRSTGREAVSVNRSLAAGGIGAEFRSTSEPPRQCWADMEDDPDELPLLNMFLLPSLPSLETSQLLCQEATQSSEEIISTDAVVAPSCVDVPSTRNVIGSLDRWAPPVSIDIMNGLSQRTPSCGDRASSCTTRSRSLTRARRGERRRQASNMAPSEDSLGLRCTSEPPSGCWLDVFDDPFEPPPQDMQWSALRMLTTPNVVLGCELSREKEPASALKGPLMPATVIVNAQPTWTSKRWASPKRVETANVVVERGHYGRSPSCTARARSLTRSREGAMRREASASVVRSEYMEVVGPRCTSEPPHNRWMDWIDVYDDPFEPPPQDQEFWRLPFVPAPAAARTDTPHEAMQELQACAPIAGVNNSAAAMQRTLGSEPTQVKAFVALPLLNVGQIAGGTARHRRNSRARSLTRVSSAEVQQDRSSSRRHMEVTCTRCTSEPPQQRIVNVFDDPFEPPPQDMWLAATTPVHTLQGCTGY